MRTKKLPLFAALLAFSATSFVYAVDAGEEAAAEPKFPKWQTNAELGAIWTSGNTETNSLNAKFDTKREGELWTWQFKASALGSKEKSEVSKEKYDGSFKLDRNFSDRTYLTMMTQREHDRFSGFKYQNTSSAGLGYKAVKRSNMTLDLEVGPGYYRERLRKATDEGSRNEEVIGRFALKYSWTIREGVTFSEEFSVEAGEDNQLYRSETGLKTQINGSLATKLTYKVKHTAEVPDKKKRTDGEFGVTLVFSF